MKKFSFLYVLVLLTFALSCSHVRENDWAQDTPETTEAVQTGTITFTASLDQGSRTQFGEDWSVLWSEGDQIKVFNNAHPEGVSFSLIRGEGTPYGTFSGPDPGAGPFQAVYPADRAGKGSRSSIPVSFPSTQTYAEGSFGPGANLAAGAADQLDGLRFHNLAGALSLTLAGDQTITGIRLCSNGEEQLWGSASIKGWTEDVPTVSFDSGQDGASFREVYLDCGKGVVLTGEGVPFHLIVPAGTLAGGYRIEVYDSEGLAMVKYAQAHADSRVDRSEVVRMPVLNYNPAYNAAFLNSGEIGAFANVSARDGMSAICTYVEGTGQFAYLTKKGESRYIRLENWVDRYALGFTMPYSLEAGKNCAVTLQSLGQLPIVSETVENMRVVKLSEDKVWMLDPATDQGFILMMEE